MNIKGLQKLTLLDFPEKIACIVFVGGCNFKCPFCHNASLVTGECDSFVSEDEFFDYLNKRIGIIEGVVISGGEPTLQSDLDAFLTKIKSLGFLVKLDTNGYRPDVLKQLINKKLVDYIAMDIKNCKEKYSVTAGKEDIDISRVEESVNLLVSSEIEYEFRTTIVKELHTSDDLVKIANWIINTKRYYLQSFKDSGDILLDGFSSYDEKELKNLLKVVKSLIPPTVLR